MGYSIKCRLCNGKFKWNPLDGYPTHCAHCNAYIGIDVPDDVIVMPAFLGAKTKATDKLYRDMEAGSQFRAEKAAEMTGSSVSDMASLKITDMKDNMRAGDMAAVEANAAMDRLKASTRAPVGFADNGASYSDGVSSGAVSINGKVITGIEPRAGARAVERVQRIMGR